MDTQASKLWLRWRLVTQKNYNLKSVWPPVKINPTMANVKALRRERQAEAEDEKKAKRDRGEEVDSEEDESQQE